MQNAFRRGQLAAKASAWAAGEVGQRAARVYLTRPAGHVDMLGLAHVPGTGTPQAGGLSSGELLDTLRSLARLNLVGADIVEVAPAYAWVTGIAAAHAGYVLLSAFAARKGA